MAEGSTKNHFSVIGENAGHSEFNMGGNSQMINHSGDNYFNINVARSDDQPTTCARAALNEAARQFPSSSKEEHSELVHEKLCDVVNKNTIQNTRVSVIEDFSKKKLNEPDFEVYPQMRKVEDYFEGGCKDWEKSEIVITKSRFLRRPKMKVFNNQTRREMGFHFQKTRDDEETLTFVELLESFTRVKKLGPDEVNPVTGIVASAGSGKTTLLRRLAGKCATKTIARNALIKEKRQAEEDRRSPKTTLLKRLARKCAAHSVTSESVSTASNEADENSMRIKMVHYMEMKNMKYKDDTDISTFLFDGLYKNKEDEKKAYQWLLEHQSEAILYFDGLDQATWSIPTRNKRKISSFQKTNTSEIMYNLLSCNLLPHVKIVFSSRQFKVSELPPEARPEEIINLVGLRRADAKKLFVCLVGDRGAELWGKMQTVARRLVNLVSIPVFLLLTAALTTLDPDSPPPVTITELYRRIMLNLNQVENIRERDQIQIVIKKLKAMAHQGMVEGRVVFTNDDLKKYDLSMQDVRDLMIKVPGNNLLSRYLVEGDFIFFFCHQSLQEYLSASFIAEMKESDFSCFNELHLHESRWSVVCALVSGIIHDKSDEIFRRVSEMKRTIFCRQIQSRCEKEDKAVGLLAAIYESNNDDLIQSLPCLPRLSSVKIFTSLGPDEAHMFSSIWARRGNEKKENKVDFHKCGLNDELLDIMVQNLKDRKIRVGCLALSANLQPTPKGLKPFLALFKANTIRIDLTLLKDFRHEDFDWNNITKIVWSAWGLRRPLSISMTNKGERIEITGIVNGYFDKTPRAFETDVRLHFWLFPHRFENEELDLELGLANFYQQKFFQAIFQNQIYVKPSDLSGMKNLNADHNVDWKIPKMLLDCRWEENVDSSLIEFCVENFQVSFLDIVVDDETSFVPGNFPTEIESHIPINVNVHWWFYVTDSDDVTKLIPIVQQNQVENLRVRIKWRGSSFDDIKRVIENCKVKELTLVYSNDDDKLRMQHDKSVKLGTQHSIEIDGVTWSDECGAAWGYADFLPSSEAN